jgi:FAD binding domain-containing protein
LNIDRSPALILRAADAADVIRGITFAREQGLPLAVRSGGHGIAGHGTVDNGLVIDLRRMHGLSLDPETRIAWAQPGLTWGAYAERAHACGLATSAGDTASVGVGGLTLGGSIGWMITNVMPAPPAPFIPADQVGKPVAIIGVCYAGDIETGQRVVQPLRSSDRPSRISRAPCPIRQCSH